MSHRKRNNPAITRQCRTPAGASVFRRPFDWRTVAARISALLVLAVALMSASGNASAAKPEIDEVYAQGNIYYMIGPHTITNPNPHLFAQSEELYIVAYPWDGTTAPVLASGYVPQCNPCYHPGLPSEFVYHDHVLSGAPGLGTNGTAGEFKGPWIIILVMYNASVLSDPNFQLVTSEAELDAAEQAGEFQVINPGAVNPYEIITPNVLICPFVSPNA